MTVREIFEREQIEYVSALDISEGDIRRPDMLLRRGLSPSEARCALVFLIPYYVDDGDGNISFYARGRDYHAFCEDMFSRVCGALIEEFGGKFVGFADKSPIEETNAAQRAGLGARGDNYVIINEKYGSFVFIGEILTDIPARSMKLDGAPKQVRECLHCGACRRACPMKDGRECLSALTQKKGELTKKQRAYIAEYGSVWGCDICQTACPLNKNVAQTPIEFFRRDRISTLTYEALSSMTEEEFLSRAFSWRGRETLLRNLEITGNK